MVEDPNHPWLMEGGAPVILAAGRLVEQKDFPHAPQGIRPCR